MVKHQKVSKYYENDCMYHQQTNCSQQTIEKTKVIQEVVSPEVSKLNHAVLNKKHFSLEKIQEKKKIDSSLLSNHRTGGWFVL